MVGAGAMYRSFARSVAGLLPGIGNLLKAAIAFGGTMATARGVRASLEGWSLSELIGVGGVAEPAPFSAGPVAPLPTPSEAAGEQAVQYLQIDPDGKARS